MITTRTVRIPEILEGTTATSSTNEKIAMLKAGMTPALLAILNYTYNPNKRTVLTGRDIDEALNMPYRPVKDELGMAPTHLYREYKRLYLFYGEGETKLPTIRLVNMIVQLREALHPSEFDIIVNMLLKKPLVPGLTKTVAKAFVKT